MTLRIPHFLEKSKKRTIFFRIFAVLILLLGMQNFYEFQKKHRRHAQNVEQLDFPAYFLAKHMADERRNLYRLDEIEEAAAEKGISFEIFRANLYSPPFYLFLLPVPDVSILDAQAFFVSIKALLLTLVVLSLSYYLLGMEPYNSWKGRGYWVALLTGIGLYILPFLNPLESDFRDGQINVLTLAMILAAMYTERRYPVVSGIALSLGTVIKLSPAFLGLKLILEKRWIVILSVSGTLTVLGLVSVLYFSLDTVTFYVREVLLGFMATDQIPILEWPINHTLNQSFKGLYYRLFISNFDMDLGGTAVVYYNPLLGKTLTLLTNAAWVISCGVLTYHIKKMPEDRWKSSFHYSYYVAVMTMVSPLTWYHHQVVLILPLLVLLYYGLLKGRDGWIVLLGTLFATVLFYFPPFYTYFDFRFRGFSAFYYVKLYANVMLALLILLALKKERDRIRSKSVAGETVSN